MAEDWVFPKEQPSVHLKSPQPASDLPDARAPFPTSNGTLPPAWKRHRDVIVKATRAELPSPIPQTRLAYPDVLTQDAMVTCPGQSPSHSPLLDLPPALPWRVSPRGKHFILS